MTTIADVVTEEQLAAYAAQSEQSTIEVFEQNLIPLVRDMSGYQGEVSVTATATVRIVEDENGQATLTNDVVVGLAFPPQKYNDLFDDVQRTIFSEFFNLAVEKIRS